MASTEIGEMMGVGVEGPASEYGLADLRTAGVAVLPASAESWAELPSAYFHGGLEAARQAALRGEEPTAAVDDDDDESPESLYLSPDLNDAIGNATRHYNAAANSDYALANLNDLRHTLSA